MATPIFCFYEKADERIYQALRSYLRSSERAGFIDLIGGYEQDAPITVEALPLDHKAIFVLLVSPDFMASDKIDALVRQVLGLEAEGKARVIPVLVRPVALEWTQLASHQSQLLPDRGQPISTWKERDEAWLSVVRGIHRIILAENMDAPLTPEQVPSAREASALQLLSAPPVAAAPRAASGPKAPVLPIDRIFRTVGQPDINFVAPEQLGDIKVRLKMMGQGLVVQGPSGVGKTTAVRRGLDELSPSPPVILLSSKRPSDGARLREILASSLSAGGHLVIDDFHLLAADLQREVAGLIKLLADDNRADAKVTLVGINPIGQSLVRDLPDLANRFTVVTMGKQSEEKIDELIKKGAHAANVRFERHAEFVREAAGSFFTAQLLCLEALLKEGVTETAPALRRVTTGPTGYVMDKVLQGMSAKYHDALIAFAACDERPPPRGACLALLWLLSQAEDVCVSLERARHRYPTLEPAFAWLMASNLSRHFDRHPRLRDLFLYRKDAAVLSVEDPQLEFYLRNLRWESFARDTGHEGLRWDLLQGPLFEAAAPAVVTAVDLEPPPTTPWPLPPSLVLHLSDLHFGTKAQALHWAGQLSEDLQGELRCKRLDAVIVSGDIANLATTEEYAAASHFLMLLKQDFKVSPQQIILVPGNHDVSWQAARDAYSIHRRDAYQGNLEPGAFKDGGEYIEVPDAARYQRRFAAFADLYLQVRGEPYPLEAEQQATLHHMPAQKLLVLGLNSAWRLDHHFRDRADIHQVALGQALRLVRQTEVYAECVKLAVWHHPIHSGSEDRIKDSGFIERLAQAGFRLALHGHIHKAEAGQFLYDRSPAGRRLDILGAGTFGAPLRELVPGYPFQYQLLRFRDDRVTIETRRREEPDGAWKPDARWGQGAGRDPLPRYEISLR